ncbi:MAG: ABC transporter ATP-binding protein [candidate division Zixibacteria bacterium]|nr:ABC transporter ATP-binding protein [candidate division Zixibacteria bacterium]
MDSRQSALTAKGIHRMFKTPDTDLNVLNGIDITIEKGEMVAVTGESGAGKSTLLHILGGLDKPTRGEVFIGNTNLRSKTERELARLRNKKIGFVFQFHYLLDDFTASENVMMPLLVAGKPYKDAKKRAELILEKVGLKDRRKHFPMQLSGGEQQRVAVARALANDCEIVLADEPSGNLDIETGRKLHELLFELNKSNQTTFMIATHNRELAGRCHRELELVDGRTVERTKNREK